MYSFKYGNEQYEQIARLKDDKWNCGPWVLRDLEYFEEEKFYSDKITISYNPLCVNGNLITTYSFKDDYSIRPAMWVDLSTAEEKEQKQKRLEEERKKKQEQAIKAAEEKKKSDELKAERREKGVCQYCGGEFKGWLIKKCSACGKRKDY